VGEQNGGCLKAVLRQREPQKTEGDSDTTDAKEIIVTREVVTVMIWFDLGELRGLASTLI
jgi:hypothetical protein